MTVAPPHPLHDRHDRLDARQDSPASPDAAAGIRIVHVGFAIMRVGEQEAPPAMQGGDIHDEH
ncbi:MAG: hypothetical protein ACRDSS_15345 [Actinocrinis sp.]